MKRVSSSKMKVVENGLASTYLLVKLRWSGSSCGRLSYVNRQCFRVYDSTQLVVSNAENMTVTGEAAPSRLS